MRDTSAVVVVASRRGCGRSVRSGSLDYDARRHCPGIVLDRLRLPAPPCFPLTIPARVDLVTLVEVWLAGGVVSR